MMTNKVMTTREICYATKQMRTVMEKRGTTICVRLPTSKLPASQPSVLGITLISFWGFDCL